jgi:hypothetical protein
MPIFDHFDFLAPLYETFIPPKDPQEMWAMANLPVSGALLDAGGGTGQVAWAIAPLPNLRRMISALFTKRVGCPNQIK